MKVKYLGMEKMIRKLDILQKCLTVQDYKKLILSRIYNFQVTVGKFTPILGSNEYDISYVSSVWHNILLLIYNIVIFN